MKVKLPSSHMDSAYSMEKFASVFWGLKSVKLEIRIYLNIIHTFIFDKMGDLRSRSLILEGEEGVVELMHLSICNIFLTV